MHAIRRVPAERARHAKRLGHAQMGSEPAVLAGSDSNATTSQSATIATTASTQTPSTSTSAKQSSSSAPPSSVTQPSSSAPSSATSSSTSSVASSTSTQSLATTTPSSPLITPPTPSLSTSANSSPTFTPQANASAASNNGLSGGAIAGIIAGAVIVGVALIVFFVRKTYLRRRERKRISWSGAPGLGADTLDEPKFPDVTERPASFTSAANAAQRSAPLSPFEPHGQSMYSTPVPPVMHMQPPTIPTYAVPTPPPATYNNPTPLAPYPVPSTYGPRNIAGLATAGVVASAGMSSTLSPVHSRPAPMEAAVKCTFVPSLPDELSIATGERVFVIEQYDDGWDLCANARGERGMVPRECLELVPSNQSDIGWRNVRRTSSLNPDGRRY